jgi:hypothetical protein
MKTKFIIGIVTVIIMQLMVFIHLNAAISYPLLDGRVVTVCDSMPIVEKQNNETWTEFGEDGSISFSSETARLIEDSVYRAEKFPTSYNAMQVADLLEDGQIAFALWTIINIYDGQPEQVQFLASRLAQQGVQGRNYLSAFYTYAFADPQIMDFESDRKPYLKNPKRLEEKLWSCRAVAAYTDKLIEMHTDGK